MNRFIDELGNVYTVDEGKNLFKNGKLHNQKSTSVFTGISVKEATEQFLEQPNIKSYSIVIGHVPNFEYGYGENKVKVNTVGESW